MVAGAEGAVSPVKTFGFDALMQRLAPKLATFADGRFEDSTSVAGLDRAVSCTSAVAGDFSGPLTRRRRPRSPSARDPRRPRA
jgi:hypothetical protein